MITSLAQLQQLSPDWLQCIDHPQGLVLHDTRGQLAALETGFTQPAFIQLKKTLTPQQPLWRALGKPMPGTLVVDLNAGLGRDSFMLAHLGAQVLSIEANPFLAALLQWQITQYQQQQPQLSWQVVQADSLAWLKQRTEPVQLALADPFFEKNQSALPQKNMQWLHQLGQPMTVGIEAFIDSCSPHCQRLVAKGPKGLKLKSRVSGIITQKSSCFYILPGSQS